MVYPLGKLSFLPLIKIVWVKEIKGISNLPKHGSFIFACNHSSFIDDILLPSVICPYLDKYVHIYCNDRFFNNFFIKMFIKLGRVIPIRTYKSKEQKTINKKAFELALGYLNVGEPVGIFPEGHRSKDGKLQKAYQGVAKLVLGAKVPVIPIGIIGTYEIWPKGAKLPNLKKCKINIGKALYFKSKSKEKITKEIMQEIAKLSKQRYDY